MQSPILEGFLTGASTILLVGPVFFTLLQIVLNHGYKAGLSVALGIITSDCLVIGLFYFGAEPFFKKEIVQMWMAGIGSLVLFFLGVKYLLKQAVLQETVHQTTLASHSGYFMKGFLVNFVNPFVFFVWVSILTYASTSFTTEADIRMYIVSVLVGIFATDSLKIAFAAKLQRLLNISVLRYLYISIGCLLVVFGCRLVYVFYQLM